MKGKREHLSKCNGKPTCQAEDFREPHCLHYNSSKKYKKKKKNVFSFKSLPPITPPIVNVEPKTEYCIKQEICTINDRVDYQQNEFCLNK